MQLFCHGAPWPGAAVDQPSSRLVVFVHGLGGSERSWPTEPGERASYVDLLEHGLGATALALRYNTGRHVSDNGRELCARARASWSSGGRCRWSRSTSSATRWAGSCCARPATSAPTSTSPGSSRVRHVAYLGTPHRGAPLEQLARLGLGGLARIGETRPTWPTWAVGAAPGSRICATATSSRRTGATRDVDGIDDHRHLLPLLPGRRALLRRRHGHAPTGSLRPARRPVRALPQRRTRSRWWSSPIRGSPPTTSTSGSTRHLELLHHPEVGRQLLAWCHRASESRWGACTPRRPGPGELGDPGGQLLGSRAR